MAISLVSVVIPSYNHEKYIGKTIDSILGQTVLDLELIIIDDGSRDQSVRLIEAKIRENPTRDVRLISRPNKGICKTLNEGLRLSSGKYFSYCGSDDYWHPEKLEKQISALDSLGGNYLASYTDSFIVDESDNVIGRYSLQSPFIGGDIYRDLAIAEFQPTSPTTLFTRKAILSVGGFNEDHFIEDRDLWLRISRIYDVVYLDEPLAYYRTHGTNTGTSNLVRMRDCTIDALRRACRVDPLLHAIRHQIEAKMDAHAAGNHYNVFEMGMARRLALRSLLANPFERLAWRTLLFSFLGKGIIEYFRNRRKLRQMADLSVSNR